MGTSTPTTLAGRYRVVERLGTGGMATVYLAEDERLGRKVAIKRLHGDGPEDGAQRFEREAKFGASLSHPNLVTVFDTVADDEGVLIVMEYVAGENLAQLMARQRVPAERALSIISQVAAALDHAHEAGVIHRDVKPANILISPDGKAKLVDLGIATANERTQITAVGTVLGTPSYMAPEQLEGRGVSTAVDVYALGAVAFELLSGRKARQGRTPVEIAHQIATEPPPDIREAWPTAPPAAAAALERAMARDPDDRPRSAGALARALDDAFKSSAAADPAATQAMPIPFQADERPRTAAAAAPPPRRRGAPPRAERSGLPRWIPVAILAAAVLVAAGAIIALTSGGDGTAPVVQTTKTPKKPAKKNETKSASKQDSSTQQQPAQTQTQATQTQTTQATQAQPASGNPAQMQAQAHGLIDQGKYDDAIAIDRQVVAMGPSTGLTYAYALYDLGHALRLAGRPAEAIPILEQRLKINNQRGVVKQELERAKRDAGSG